MNNKLDWNFTQKEQEEVKGKYRKFNKLIEKDDFWIKIYKELEKNAKLRSSKFYSLEVRYLFSSLKDIYFLLKANKYHILGAESLTRFHMIYAEVFRRLLIKKGMFTKEEINSMSDEVYKEEFERIKKEKIQKKKSGKNK